MTARDIVFLLAAASSLGLGALAMARRPRGLLRWSFALGMAGFALESATAFVLVTQTDAPDERLFWLKATLITGLLLVVPWGIFVGALRLSRRLWLGLGFGTALTAASAAAAGWLTAFQVADFAGVFYAARVESVGRIAILVQLLATVALLAGLEGVLRTAKREARWRIKYLVLGLGGVLLVRFYFLSQIALFNVTMASYLVTQAATLLIANMAISASLMRDRLGVELAVSRQVLYRSVVVGVLGVYLLAVVTLGWLLSSLGIAEELFFGSVVIFISALGRIGLVKDLAPLPIAADAESLSKVIQNLVANAVQSIDDKGTVTLRTFGEDGKAVVSITDTGCGMSEEFVRKSLFAPFRSTKKGGWGIGLYQARGIVEAHGGAIEVSSQEGAGSTFTVKLPLGNKGRQ